VESGDVILGLNGVPVESGPAFSQDFRSQSGSRIFLQVRRRDGRLLELRLPD